jgi:hypothetical protein
MSITFILKRAKMSEIDREEELLKKRFFLERFYVRELGIPGKLVPLAFTMIFLIIGIYAGIFTNEIEYSAKISYIFWILFIPLTVYLMTWLDKTMKKTIRETNKLIKYEDSVQKSLLNSLYGLPGILMSIIIALPFIIYDITGFGFTSEGWIKDIQIYFADGDNSWYPRITETTNGVGFGSLLWLILWIIPWFFMGAFIWMSFSFAIYMRAKLKETKWKDDIQKVIREKQHRKLLTLSIMTYLPLSPYIAVKFIFQTFFEPWWSDTISLYILFIIFIVGTIIAPSIIAKDIDEEKEEFLLEVDKIENAQFNVIAKNLIDGKEVNTDALSKAIVTYLYTEKLKTDFKKKTLDRHLVNKMIVAALVPIITYGVRYIIPIFG